MTRLKQNEEWGAKTVPPSILFTTKWRHKWPDMVSIYTPMSYKGALPADNLFLKKGLP